MRIWACSFSAISESIALLSLGILSGCGTIGTSSTDRGTLSSTVAQPPIADAGEAPMAVPGETVVLDGSRSYDPNGDPLQITWTQVSGEPVTLMNADTLTPEFTAPELDQSSILLFNLEVSDGVSTAEDRVAVGIPAVGDSIAIAGVTADPLCGFSVSIDGNFEQRDGPRPLYVTMDAITIVPEVPGDAVLTWVVDGIEDGGSVSSHTSRMRAFTVAGLHTIALALTVGGVTTGCESIQNGQLQETVKVWPTVSGRVETEAGSGVPAVTVSATAGGTTGVTDDTGEFTVHVPNGWSGVISAQHVDYAFAPGSQVFTDVTDDVSSGSFMVVTTPQPPVPNGPGDTCPDDPNKTEPGVCGCGVPDTDTDGDGVLDCNDGCASDPNKTAPGACGCGFPDTDANGNGTADCMDGPSTPLLVLDIPTPTAVRMSPCPVFASLDFDASSTGDGSTWDQCKITWSLMCVGGLASWPAKYRYVTDPRPGLNGVQRDLASEGRGFNMAWLLTEGDWTITCTVTNPSRLVTVLSSATITIAPNTRTKVYVNSATGVDDITHGNSAGTPYATLGYAFSRHGTTDEMDYILAGGHVESIDQAATGSSSPNAYIHWDGLGIKPVFSWTGTQTGVPNLFALNNVNQVWEGVSAQESMGNTSVRMFIFRGRFSAIVDCDALGTFSGNHFGTFAFPDASGLAREYHGSNILVLRCSSTVTEAYSLVFQSAYEYRDIVLAGCIFGPSANESVIRFNWTTNGANILWSTLTEDGEKSTLRFANGSFMHAFGCKLRNGDNLIGIINRNEPLVWNVRFEANHISGFSTNTNIIVADGSTNVTICNNVVHNDSGINKSLIGIQTPIVGINNFHIFNNLLLNGSTGEALSSNLFSGHAGVSFQANLHIIVTPLLRQESDYYYSVGNPSAIALVKNNVHTPLSSIPGQTKFAQIFPLPFRDYPASVSEWNVLSFVTNDLEVDTVANEKFVPTPRTTVTTPVGVYDDYYGTPRSSISTAGAVE